MRIARVLLVIVGVICLGVALSYPLRYRQAQEKNDTDMEQLARMRQQARQSQAAESGDRVVYPAFPGLNADDTGEEEAPPGAEPAPETGEEEASPGAEPALETGEKEDAANAGSSGGAGSPEASTVEPGGEGAGAPEGRSNPESLEAAGKPAAPTPKPTPTPEPTREPNYWDLGKYFEPTPSPTPRPTRRVKGPTVAPTPTPDRSIRNGPLPYALKEKAVLDKAAMLPELKEIYALNNDLVGWISIPNTVIDYPVVQAEDGEFYLSHDFYGEENVNGQIILDVLCDPYTPSYNLVVSGHHMKNGSMFGGLPEYRNKSYWQKHPFLEFDSLMRRKLYVIFACFYSADYDEDETGFRYNAIIDYKIDAERWLKEIEENQLYDTGIEREFGDEFITLTTCDRARHRNGRFVVVGRRIREGETFE